MGKDSKILNLNKNYLYLDLEHMKQEITQMAHIFYHNLKILELGDSAQQNEWKWEFKETHQVLDNIDHLVTLAI